MTNPTIMDDNGHTPRNESVPCREKANQNVCIITKFSLKALEITWFKMQSWKIRGLWAVYANFSPEFVRKTRTGKTIDRTNGTAVDE